jgi:hypothetical protein
LIVIIAEVHSAANALGERVGFSLEAPFRTFLLLVYRAKAESEPSLGVVWGDLWQGIGDDLVERFGRACMG